MAEFGVYEFPSFLSCAVETRCNTYCAPQHLLRYIHTRGPILDHPHIYIMSTFSRRSSRLWRPRRRSTSLANAVRLDLVALEVEIAEMPHGVYFAQDCMEDDGVTDKPYWMRLRLTIRGDEALCDWLDFRRSGAGADQRDLRRHGGLLLQRLPACRLR